VGYAAGYAGPVWCQGSAAAGCSQRRSPTSGERACAAELLLLLLLWACVVHRSVAAATAAHARPGLPRACVWQCCGEYTSGSKAAAAAGWYASGCCCRRRRCCCCCWTPSRRCTTRPGASAHVPTCALHTSLTNPAPSLSTTTTRFNVQHHEQQRSYVPQAAGRACACGAAPDLHWQR
jgi:hypothetical protein